MKNYLINLVKYIMRFLLYKVMKQIYICYIAKLKKKNMANVLKFMYIVFLFVCQIIVVHNNERTLFIIFTLYYAQYFTPFK